MERYKVSGDDLRQFYQNDIVLAQVFQDIENDLRAQKKVVCQYVINGLEVAEENEGLFSRWTLDKIQSLEYWSESIMSLVEEVSQAWIDALPELIAQSEVLSKKIKNQQVLDVTKPFQEFIENCEYFIHSLISIRGILGDSIAGFPFDWNKTSEKSLKTMSKALDQLERKDFKNLALTFEYDLPDNLQEWLEHLYKMDEMFYGGPSATSENKKYFMDAKRYQN